MEQLHNFILTPKIVPREPEAVLLTCKMVDLLNLTRHVILYLKEVITLHETKMLVKQS